MNMSSLKRSRRKTHGTAQKRNSVGRPRRTHAYVAALVEAVARKRLRKNAAVTRKKEVAYELQERGKKKAVNLQWRKAHESRWGDASECS